MNRLRSSGNFFEIPHAMVFLLITLNVAAYALCLNQSGTIVISTEVLFRSGAMYSAAIERREYWRLVAYGFLHADLFHLATNMICLTLWGGHLEKRIGSFNFILVYLCALIVLVALTVYFLGTKSIFLRSREEEWVPLLAYFILCLGLIKFLDLVLSFKKGLAIIVIMLSVANAALVSFIFDAFLPVLHAKCAARQLQTANMIEGLFGAACANVNMAVNIVAACAFAITILAYWSELHRGIKDVGFVGASLRAERQRRRGI